MIAKTLVVAVTLSLAAPHAYADRCTALAGNTYCGFFRYSSGGSNSYTVAFGSAGSFTLGGSSTGTYTCPGRNFLETDYLFGGLESQTWYGSAKTLRGFGKSQTNGYLYSFALAPGACPAAHQPGARQDR